MGIKFDKKFVIELSEGNKMSFKYTGSCKCGNIRYGVKGEAQWKVSCHCNWCQTTSGAAFRTFVLFKESDLEISGDTLKSYEDIDTDHGRPISMSSYD